MSVSALSSDIATAHVAALGGLAPRAISTGFDFAAALFAAQDFLAVAAPTPHDSATKTEAARSSSVAGHVRTTIISFTDGSSEIVTSAADAATPSAPMPVFDMNIRPARFAVEGNSDLEPEIGLPARTEAQRARPARRPSTGAAARKAASASAEIAPAVRPSTPWHERPVGKMIDLFV